MKGYRVNPLYKKRVVFDGDSICQAGTSGDGWTRRIGERNEMEWYNYGIGGGTLTAEMYAESGKARHWISRSIDKIHEKHPTLDYLILEGGTNDADLLGIGSEKFGELDLGDYSGNYDDTTFTGALDSLFFKAISYYPTARIGFIVAQRMGATAPNFGPDYKRRHYFLRAIEVCKKWGIPYVDLWDGSTLNPKLPCHFNPSLDEVGNENGGFAYMDGQHPTNTGFDMIAPKIEEWMLTI